jgi:hypothetical protein
MLTAGSRVDADPARFWISTSNAFTQAHEVPVIDGLNNVARYHHIWAQPAPGKTLESISMNLVTNPNVVGYLNETIVVHNPIINGTKRYDFISDSSTGLVATGPSPYRIRGIQGVNVSGNPIYTGMGGVACHAEDPYCAMTPSGPAWLFATVASQAITDNGSAEYFLQVGQHGINHVGELTSAMTVDFGAEGGPIYSAFSNRETNTVSGNTDTAHLVLNAHPQASAIDTHWSTGDTAWHQLAGGAAPSWLHNVFLEPGAGVVTVTGARQANSTTIYAGRLHLDADSTLSSGMMVDTGGSISGSGGIGANLVLDGSLVIDSMSPLRVGGTADIEGGTLAIAPGYSQASNTVSDEFAVLTAGGGFLCGGISCAAAFNATPGMSLGPGYKLESIAFEPANSPKSIMIRVRATLVGDYNADGEVDVSDFVSWSKGGPLANEGTTEGVTEPGDYPFWSSNFGMSANGGGGAASNPIVPEPASVLLVIISLCCVISRRHA